MDKKMINTLFACALCLITGKAFSEGIVVIGSAQLPKLDAATVQKLYTGRVVEIAGSPVIVVNAAPGTSARRRFLAAYLGQDEEKFIAYWTVRRFIGKGLPPREIDPSAAVIQFVQANPNAIGYIDADDLRPGLNVVNRQ